MNRQLTRVIILAAIFSIAMGFLEGAVVVYLRELYYPTGFKFPMVPIGELVGITELIREASTIVMLITFAAIAGHDATRRFGFFLFAFGTWDLVYYIALKLVLDWPSSIMDWDILFLIPVPWFSPVLAPCLVSVLMIILAFQLFRSPLNNISQLIRPASWALLCSGSIVIIGSFVIDYLVYAIPLAGKFSGNTGLLSELSQFIPGDYRWWIFLTGYSLICAGMLSIQKQKNKFIYVPH